MILQPVQSSGTLLVGLGTFEHFLFPRHGKKRLVEYISFQSVQTLTLPIRVGNFPKTLEEFSI